MTVWLGEGKSRPSVPNFSEIFLRARLFQPEQGLPLTCVGPSLYNPLPCPQGGCWMLETNQARSPQGGQPSQVTVEDQSVSAGAGIRVLRLKSGLSARQLSKKAGLSPSYVDKLERNEIVPSLRAFARLALALQMNSLEAWVLICEAAKD